jgi:hypothetical protein
MRDEFVNKLDWFTLAAAFAIWAAHFMLAWTISSVLPGERIVLWLTVALTAIALGLLALLWRRRRVVRIRSVPGLAIAMATLAVLFDFAPALLA